MAEGLHGLTIGFSGNVGSEAAPVRFGDGLFWVEATETDDGYTRLESTGLCAGGRATLAATYERVETPLGFFADEGITLETPVLMDGFSSGSGSYSEQVSAGSITIDPSYPYLFVDKENQLLFYEEIFYRFDSVVDNTYTFDEFLDHKAHPELGIDWDDFIDDFGEEGDDFFDTEYATVLEYFAALPIAEREAGIVLGSGGLTTGGGVTLGSNGSIALSSDSGSVEIYGDVVPGVESELVLGAGVTVSGDTQPRAETVVLGQVDVPAVVLQPAVYLDDVVPMVVSAGDVGYASIDVAADSELIVRGPCNLVVDQLRLAAGAQLTLDTTDGDVQLFVTGTVDLEPGSIVETPGQSAEDVAIQVSSGGPSVQLNAASQFYGSIYAPDAEVAVGADFEIYGSLVSRLFSLAPGTRLHYDNSLFGAESLLPKFVSWRIVEIPETVRFASIDPFQMLGVDRSALQTPSEGHDLTGIEISVTYIDWNGVETSYSGPEANFDWSKVAKVVCIKRWKEGAWTTELDEGKPVGAPNQDAQDTQGEGDQGENQNVRTAVQSWIDLVETSGLVFGGSLFVSEMTKLVPLSSEEWVAIESMTNRPPDTELDKLRTADQAAGGTGGQ